MTPGRFLVMFVPLAVSLRPRLVSVVFPSLDTTTHQLTTVWSGGTSLDQSMTSLDQSVCNHLKIFLMERGWTGKLVRADCGLAGFDYCGLNKGEELVVRLDIRQCRVQQFRSYQLCLAGEGDMCTDFFSLEMNIPFVESRRDEDQDSWGEEDEKKSVSGFDDHNNRRSQESGKKNNEEYLAVSNNTIVSKGIFSVIAKEEDNKDEIHSGKTTILVNDVEENVNLALKYEEDMENDFSSSGTSTTKNSLPIIMFVIMKLQDTWC